MSRTFTTEETMLRVWDVEEIKKLMSRRVYYIANEWRARELDELWVSDPEHQKTASFGRNTGYYVGMEEIRKYYVDRHLAEMGDGTGYLSNHPVSTGLVREAEDGRTAKGMWYSIAQETRPNGDGTALALWMPEKIAVDFIREDDGWKIWHYFIGTDLQVEAGQLYGDQPVDLPDEENPVAVEFGKPTLPMEAYITRYNYYPYPAIPEPYETYRPELGCGPEGNPKYQA